MPRAWFIIIIIYSFEILKLLYSDRTRARHIDQKLFQLIPSYHFVISHNMDHIWMVKSRTQLYQPVCCIQSNKYTDAHAFAEHCVSRYYFNSANEFDQRHCPHCTECNWMINLFHRENSFHLFCSASSVEKQLHIEITQLWNIWRQLDHMFYSLQLPIYIQNLILWWNEKKCGEFITKNYFERFYTTFTLIRIMLYRFSPFDHFRWLIDGLDQERIF